ncbi:hypothetical protein ACFPRL_25400 [Pseudoclavibacter helvolus]
MFGVGVHVRGAGDAARAASAISKVPRVWLGTVTQGSKLVLSSVRAEAAEETDSAEEEQGQDDEEQEPEDGDESEHYRRDGEGAAPRLAPECDESADDSGDTDHPPHELEDRDERDEKRATAEAERDDTQCQRSGA